jgi:3-phosphoshikimate 1-carboxyvinyltransferase
VANLRLKETDRLAALARELGRLGAAVELQDDGLTIHPPAKINPAAIDTYDDHRMAMSFSLVGLAVEGITINDPGCVSKTFPDFFDRWRRLASGE